MKKKRIKTNVYIIIFVTLIINFGLIVRISNDILSLSYLNILGLLLYKIGRRYKLI